MSAETRCRSVFPAAILYPMRMADMSRFGFQEILFPSGEYPVSE